MVGLPRPVNRLLTYDPPDLASGAVKYFTPMTKLIRLLLRSVRSAPPTPFIDSISLSAPPSSFFARSFSFLSHFNRDWLYAPKKETPLR